MAKTADAALSVYTELGIINENMSLTPDSLNAPIPEGEYLIAAGVHVQPDDRVLISWCGSDAVITGPVSEEAEPLPITVTSDGQGTVTITF